MAAGHRASDGLQNRAAGLRLECKHRRANAMRGVRSRARCLMNVLRAAAERAPLSPPVRSPWSPANPHPLRVGALIARRARRRPASPPRPPPSPPLSPSASQTAASPPPPPLPQPPSATDRDCLLRRQTWGCHTTWSCPPGGYTPSSHYHCSCGPWCGGTPRPGHVDRCIPLGSSPGCHPPAGRRPHACGTPRTA